MIHSTVEPSKHTFSKLTVLWTANVRHCAIENV